MNNVVACGKSRKPMAGTIITQPHRAVRLYSLGVIILTGLRWVLLFTNDESPVSNCTRVRRTSTRMKVWNSVSATPLSTHAEFLWWINNGMGDGGIQYYMPQTHYDYRHHPHRGYPSKIHDTVYAICGGLASFIT